MSVTSFVLIALIAFGMLFLGGVRLRHLAAILLPVIAAGVLYGMSAGLIREIMRVVILIATLTVCTALVYYGWLAVYMVRNQTISGLGVSASWVYAAIPFGAGFVALATIAHFLDPQSATDKAEALAAAASEAASA